MYLLSIWNVSSAMEELNFKFYLILIHLNSPTWPVGTLLDRESQVLQFSFLITVYLEETWASVNFTFS